MSEPFSIETLVRTRSNELGLRRTDFVRHAGHTNVAKGLRRLDQLFQKILRVLADGNQPAGHWRIQPPDCRSGRNCLFVAAIIAIKQHKRADFELETSPVTLSMKRERWNDHIPCFGKPTGFIINFGPDKSVRFDLYGQRTEIFDSAYKMGQASLSTRGREFSSEELRAVLLRRSTN